MVRDVQNFGFSFSRFIVEGGEPSFKYLEYVHVSCAFKL